MTFKKLAWGVIIIAAVIVLLSAVIGTIIFIAKITLFLAIAGGVLYVWQQYISPDKPQE